MSGLLNNTYQSLLLQLQNPNQNSFYSGLVNQALSAPNAPPSQNYVGGGMGAPSGAPSGSGMNVFNPMQNIGNIPNSFVPLSNYSVNPLIAGTNFQQSQLGNMNAFNPEDYGYDMHSFNNLPSSTQQSLINQHFNIGSSAPAPKAVFSDGPNHGSGHTSGEGSGGPTGGATGVGTTGSGSF